MSLDEDCSIMKAIDQPGKYWFLSLPDEIIEIIPWLREIAEEVRAVYPVPQVHAIELPTVEIEIEAAGDFSNIDLDFLNALFCQRLNLDAGFRDYARLILREQNRYKTYFNNR